LVRIRQATGRVTVAGLSDRDALSTEASPTENDEDVAVLLDYGEGFPASAVEKPLSAVAIRNVPGG
jgi:hypothetical protein